MLSKSWKMKYHLREKYHWLYKVLSYGYQFSLKPQNSQQKIVRIFTLWKHSIVGSDVKHPNGTGIGKQNSCVALEWNFWKVESVGLIFSNYLFKKHSKHKFCAVCIFHHFSQKTCNLCKIRCFRNCNILILNFWVVVNCILVTLFYSQIDLEFMFSLFIVICLFLFWFVCLFCVVVVVGFFFVFVFLFLFLSFFLIIFLQFRPKHIQLEYFKGELDNIA